MVGTNLELVHLKGAPDTEVVRDITDIVNPRTVDQFTGVQATFVTAHEVTYVAGPALMRRPLCGSPWKVVQPTRGLYGYVYPYARPYTWSSDGKTLAYLTLSDAQSEVHVIQGGRDRVFATLPTLSPSHGCIYQSCSDQSDLRLQYSPSGAHIALVQNVGGPSLRVWSSDGKVVASSDAETSLMSVWSGDSLYFMDDKGIEVWRSSGQSPLMPGVAWIRPRASPAGGQIVYAARDTSGMSHILLLDPASGRTREIAKARSEPAFLNTHLIWYQEERACLAADNCSSAKFTATGRTFIYDLQDASETESVIQSVDDAWPHGA